MNIGLIFIYCGFLVCSFQGDVSQTSRSHHLKQDPSGNYRTFVQLEELPCFRGIEFVHRSKVDTNGNDCAMVISNDTLDDFAMQVIRNNYNMVLLKLKFLGKGIIHYTRCVIEPDLWVWTFSVQGSEPHHLHWPVEAGLWSFGLLNQQSLLKPLTIEIELKGKCSNLVVGQKNTSAIIGKRLLDLAETTIYYSTIAKNNKYNSSYVCFKSRVRISNVAYFFCRILVCPLQTVGYECCNTKWDSKSQTMMKTCTHKAYQNKDVWMALPFIVGIVLYVYSPLFILSFASAIYEKTRRNPLSYTTENTSLLKFQRLSAFERMGDGEIDGWLYRSPITVGSILLRPWVALYRRFQHWTSRGMRLIFVCMTLIIIVFNNILVIFYANRNNMYYNYTISAIKQGCPMDFLSFLLGYNGSKTYFLWEFGGVYVATGIYLLGMCIFIGIPKDLSTYLKKGLPENNNLLSFSLLNIDSCIKERLASSYQKRQTVNGYQLILNNLAGNFNMILNPGFWAYCLTIQFQRYRALIKISSQTKRILYLLLTPLYIMICVVECLLFTAYYGIPILNFAVVILRSYSVRLWSIFGYWNWYWRCVGCHLILVQFLLLLFLFYVFSLVFMSSFLFLSRVVIFVYAGIFAYPESYGYVIFASSIFVYMLESINSVNVKYKNFLEKMICVCKDINEKTEENGQTIYMEVDEIPHIPKNIFFFCVERYKPVRIAVITALLRLILVFVVLFISVYLMTIFQHFQKVGPLTRVVESTVVCMLPKILKSAFWVDKSNTQSNTEEEELTLLIDEFLHKKDEKDWRQSDETLTEPALDYMQFKTFDNI